MSGIKMAKHLFGLFLSLILVLPVAASNDDSANSNDQNKWQKSVQSNYERMSVDAKKGWQSTRDSLRESFKGMPNNMAKTQNELSWFWNACSAAFGEIGSGFAKAGPDFLKGMDSVQNGFSKAGDKFNSRPANPQDHP